MLLALLFAAVFLVALANGANANFKGVASLYGSGTSSFRTTLLWGTATTLAGSIAALFLASGLLRSFSGKGLVPDALTTSPIFLFAVALGAALTGLLATRLGFPVSTTHALSGALLGAGLASGDHTVHWALLGASFVKPLFFSPLIAVIVGALLHLALKAARLAPDHRTRTLDALHFLSGGAASFARGLNDTPKMAALLLAAGATGPRWSIAVVGATIAIGALLAARRVAETLARKITDMNPGEGFAANLATAALVTTASWHGLPVSTTHVSVGALLGIGITTRRAKWVMVGQIMLAWVTTVPCAAALAALFAALLALLPSAPA